MPANPVDPGLKLWERGFVGTVKPPLQESIFNEFTGLIIDRLLDGGVESGGGSAGHPPKCLGPLLGPLVGVGGIVPEDQVHHAIENRCHILLAHDLPSGDDVSGGRNTNGGGEDFSGTVWGFGRPVQVAGKQEDLVEVRLLGRLPETASFLELGSAVLLPGGQAGIGFLKGVERLG